MTIPLKNVVVFIILAGASLGKAQAAGQKAEILSDREMAAVKGGFCLFETCETGQPSGNCQPVPPTFAGVCGPRTCRFIPFEIPGFGVVQVCTLAGQYTCTLSGSYRKCIAGKLWDVCWNSSENVCGTISEPACNESLQEQTCTCYLKETDDDCDWTNCLLESQ